MIKTPLQSTSLSNSRKHLAQSQMIDFEIIKSVPSIPIVCVVQEKIEFVKGDLTLHLSRAIEACF